MQAGGHFMMLRAAVRDRCLKTCQAKNDNKSIYHSFSVLSNVFTADSIERVGTDRAADMERAALLGGPPLLFYRFYFWLRCSAKPPKSCVR